MSKFKELYKIDVNSKTDRKNRLTYLSWAWAWAEFMKVHPAATYEVKKNPATNMPFFSDDDIGIMVYTSVTVDNITHEMWLPVMNSFNKTMKSKEYTYKTKQGNKTVEQASMFDVNKTIMRCLTKNLAMFGLGLYIYAKEDLPELIIEYITPEQIKTINELMIETDTKLQAFLKFLKVDSLADIQEQSYTAVINALESKKEKVAQ
jgi:hypothetical protein